MNKSDFVHLHVHSDYSLIDGAAKIKALAKAAKDAEHTALALTDHGSVSGAVDFWKACNAVGVKPIIGCEAYLAPGLDDNAHLRKGTGVDGKANLRREDGKKDSFDYAHFTLLAKNEIGWKNLIKLSSTASLEGFYQRPRMSWALLTKHSEGLIALSGCLGGDLSLEIRKDKEDVALANAKRWKGLFGDDYYIELQPDVVEPQGKVNNSCLAIARQLGIKVAATADVHYIEPSDAAVQEIKICVNLHKSINENRASGLNMPPMFYYKSTEEMHKAFYHIPEALTSTREIAEKVSAIKMLPGKFFFPKFVPSTGESSVDYFKRMTREGLVKRFGVVTDEQSKRLEYEIACIERLNLIDYFLIVHDFISWARNNGVYVGPGRGSAAGALVAYCLWITDIDPLRYGLLFERFLNPDRVSMPDIDIDFDERGRGRVIEYVKRKYGEKSVAQIVTFGESKAKSSIKDVARAMDVSVADSNRLSNLIPDGPKVDLEDELKNNKALISEIEGNEVFKKVAEIAVGYEGLRRQAGRHAAGIVICDTDLVDRIPLMRVGKDEGVCTAFTMEQVEEVGLLKMDFLGLSTLTQMHDTIDLVRKTTGIDIQEDKIPIRDAACMDETSGFNDCWIHKVPFAFCRCCDKTLELLSKADTSGVFQVESGGMRNLLRQMKPDRFEDLVALVALYRPGPLGSGMDQTYIKRKNGQEDIVYDDPRLAQYLGETYGVFCYQEQLMRLSVVLAGFTMPEADNLRKATAKKKPELMAKIETKFVEGCVKGGMAIERAKTIWSEIVKFAEYSFNKSHSAAYALISWRTAWLKANYPIEFYAALMSAWSSDTEKLAGYISEARQLGIYIESPDINKSERFFDVIRTNKSARITYGLEALKKLGDKAVDAIMDSRHKNKMFRSLSHFMASVDQDRVKSADVERLAKVGALVSLGLSRSQALSTVEHVVRKGRRSNIVSETPIQAAVRMVKSEKKTTIVGQNFLFAPIEDDSVLLDLPDISEWERKDILESEKDVFGFHFSGHPLEDHYDVIHDHVTAFSDQFVDIVDSQVMVAGVITSLKPHIDQRGNPMAFLSIEDWNGTIDAVCFQKSWNEYAPKLSVGSVVFIDGVASVGKRGPSMRIGKVFTVQEAKSGILNATRMIEIFFDAVVEDWKYVRHYCPDDIFVKIKNVLTSNPGQHQVIGVWNGMRSGQKLRFDICSVDANAKVIKSLRDAMLGYGYVSMTRMR